MTRLASNAIVVCSYTSAIVYPKTIPDCQGEPGGTQRASTQPKEVIVEDASASASRIECNSVCEPNRLPVAMPAKIISEMEISIHHFLAVARGW